MTLWLLPLMWPLPLFALGGTQTNVISAGQSAVQPTTDHWFAILFEDKQVGYERISQTRISDLPASHGSTAVQERENRDHADTSGWIRRIRDTRLKLRRFGTDLSVNAIQETTESPDGLVQAWSLRRTAADGGSLERSGRWLSDKSAFEISEFAQATRRTFRMQSGPQPRSSMMAAWIPELFAGQQTEGRYPVLFPETAAIVDIDVRQGREQSLRLSSGRTMNVRKIEFWPTFDRTRSTTLLIDDQHNVVRSEQPLLGGTLVLERCDAATALGNGGLDSIDLDLASLVPVDRAIPGPEHRPVTRLRLTVPSPGQLMIPHSEFQSVQRNSASQLTITLTRPSPVHMPNSGDNRPQIPPSSAFLNSTELLNYDNFDVQRLARAAVGGSTEPAEVCRQLARYLAANLRRSPFSTNLISAGETAKTLRGDCTEHAILLAALMRSRQVPSRVVVGLIYHQRVPGFFAHMWTEAYVDGRWMPFDSTSGSSNAFPITIKVLDSALEDSQANSATLFLPLLDIIGRATVELLPDSEF